VTYLVSSLRVEVMLLAVLQLVKKLLLSQQVVEVPLLELGLAVRTQEPPVQLALVMTLLVLVLEPRLLVVIRLAADRSLW
jgi:hypothetical protein